MIIKIPFTKILFYIGIFPPTERKWSKYILYITDETARIEIISPKQINKYNLCGKRYHKVLIDKDIKLTNNKLLQIKYCQDQEIDNWIQKI